MAPDQPPVNGTKSAAERPFLAPAVSWVLMVGLGLGIWAWDLVLRPLPGGAVVLIALTVAILTQTLPVEKALGGFAHGTVWLVLAAYFMSRAVIKTGLARRIALTFVRLLGGSTLGLSYALVATDTVLAGMIPSNAARVGGVGLPIARSLAELYKSIPGSTAGLLGTILLLNLYQAD